MSDYPTPAERPSSASNNSVVGNRELHCLHYVDYSVIVSGYYVSPGGKRERYFWNKECRTVLERPCYDLGVWHISNT